MKFNLRIAIHLVCVCSAIGLSLTRAEPKKPPKDEKPLLDLRAHPANSIQKLIPSTSDGKIEALLSRGVVVYDHESMPSCFQMCYEHTGTMLGVHLSTNNISGNKNEKVGHTNGEFPWKHTAGTDGTDTKTIILAYFPDKIKVEKQLFRHPEGVWEHAPHYLWTFPTGTIFVELLIYNDHVYEMRLREKGRTSWLPTVYRPISPSELASNKWEMSNTNLSDTKIHPIPALTLSFGTAVLPSSLPTNKFIPDNGTQSDSIGLRVPSDSRSSFYPKGFISPAVSKTNCTQCHQDTTKHANDFDPRRDWYARVRGSDQVFSFHPFALECLTGSNHRGKPIKFREELKHLLDLP